MCKSVVITSTLKLKTHSQLTQSLFTGTDCLFGNLTTTTVVLYTFSTFERNYYLIYCSLCSFFSLILFLYLYVSPVHCCTNFLKKWVLSPVLPGIFIIVIFIKYLANIFPTSSIGYYQQSNLCLASFLLV